MGTQVILYQDGKFRHFMQWFMDDYDEENNATVAYFNIHDIEYIKERLNKISRNPNKKIIYNEHREYKKIKLVYMAGAYRGKTEWEVRCNIIKAEKYAALIINHSNKLFPIIPQKNTAHMGGLRENKYFLDGTMEMLKRCDYIYMIPGWANSEGAILELQEAIRLGIPEFILGR